MATGTKSRPRTAVHPARRLAATGGAGPAPPVRTLDLLDEERQHRPELLVAVAHRLGQVTEIADAPAARRDAALAVHLPVAAGLRRRVVEGDLLAGHQRPER